MRRIALVLTVALLLVVMLAAGAIPAMASMGETQRAVACNSPAAMRGLGPMKAHESVPNEDVPGAPQATAHENIPPCED